jgi:cyclophilin family peptidyl-prolyl cis-trans isomerase
MTRRLPFILAVTLLLAAPVVRAQDEPAGGPDGAASAEAEAEADAELTELRERFRLLQQSLQNAGGIEERDEPIVRALRDEYRAYAERHADSAAAVAGVLQLSIWLGDDEATDAAYHRLQALRPADGPIAMAWAQRCVSENRYGEALAALEGAEFDFDATPDTALLLSDCLYAEQRFEESVNALNAIGAEVRAANPRIQNQIDDVLDTRKEAIDLWSAEQAIRAAEAEADDLPQVAIVVPGGRIVVELFENEAPNTVANFISLAEQGFYDGTRFHRVIPNFMAQGGDPNSRPDAEGEPGQGDPGYRIPDEHTGEVYRRHFTGSLSMANRGSAGSGGCQFFLTHLPAPHLDGKHTVFGRVTEGLDVVRGIQADDEIVEVVVIRKREHEYVPETLEITPETPESAVPVITDTPG